MKRYLSIAMAVLLMAGVFTGCGCMDRNVSSHPGGMITEETTRPTIMPEPTATHATTAPTEHRTEPTTTTDATIPGTTGTTNPTETTGMARGRINNQPR